MWDVLYGGTEIGTEHILFRNAVTVEIWVEIPDIYSVSESRQENAAPIETCSQPPAIVSAIFGNSGLSTKYMQECVYGTRQKIPRVERNTGSVGHGRTRRQ